MTREIKPPYAHDLSLSKGAVCLYVIFERTAGIFAEPTNTQLAQTRC